MNSPNCYGCAHRRDVPGDAHSRCAHPVVEPVVYESAALFMLKAGDFRVGPVVVVFDRHGVNRGWAMWPVNFDPIWLRACNLRAEVRPVEAQADG